VKCPEQEAGVHVHRQQTQCNDADPVFQNHHEECTRQEEQLLPERVQAVMHNRQRQNEKCHGGAVSSEPACNKEMMCSSRKFGKGTVRKRKRRGKWADFKAAFPKQKANPAIQSKITATTLLVSRRSGISLSPAKRTPMATMTDKKRKMPRPAWKERFLKMVRRSMNSRPAVRKGISMRWEALSFASDSRTRAIRGFAKRTELTIIQTPNNSQRFKTLFRV